MFNSKKKKIVCASAVGKTAFCPHGHYLSTKYPPDKASKKRMARGTKKHEQLTRMETNQGGLGRLILWAVVIAGIVYLVKEFLIVFDFI